jgi:[lysine-biosynthesis-protein LysW]--L-2-aminoadipate ligase
MLVTRVRVEEKLLLSAFAQRGVGVELVDVRGQVLDVAMPAPSWDAVLDRCLQHSHALAATSLLENRGSLVINRRDVVANCGDKVLTTSLLSAAGVPVPTTLVAFSVDSALRAIEMVGFPAVIKPPVGSWGRLLARVNDRDAAEALLEHKATLGSVAHHVYYVQEHIAKPGRDIRVFVAGDEVLCAIDRESAHWVTNTARGAVTRNRPVTPEIATLALRAAGAVGGGVLAVDLLEDADRLLVSEVNHTMEFRNSIDVTGVDIPARVVDYTLRAVRNGQLTGAVA